MASNWKPAGKDELKLDVGVLQSSFQYEVRNSSEALPKQVIAQPNSPSKTYLGFSYRNISLGYGFANKAEPESITHLGETKSTDYALRFIGRNSFEFTYSEVQGYYIENSDEIDSTYVGVPNRIQRSDIRSRNANFMFIHNFDHEDFSFTAALTQTDRHTASGWGKFLFAGVNESEVSGDSAFVPSNVTSAFGDIGLLQHVRQTTTFVGFGLGGILARGDWYGTLVLGIGPSLKKGSSQFDGLPDKEILGSGMAGTTRFGLGYNGETHVFGLQAIADSTEVPIMNGSFLSQNIEAKLFYAYRFKGVSIPPLDVVSDLFD